MGGGGGGCIDDGDGGAVRLASSARAQQASSATTECRDCPHRRRRRCGCPRRSESPSAPVASGSRPPWVRRSAATALISDDSAVTVHDAQSRHLRLRPEACAVVQSSASRAAEQGKRPCLHVSGVWTEPDSCILRFVFFSLLVFFIRSIPKSHPSLTLACLF